MINNQEKISIVLPTYNRGNVIANAIRSIIDQTFKDWRLYVIDDGSTDGTKRIVESFANPRIIYKKIEHCGFVSKVRNVGNQMAGGDIIVVHDSDDIAFPDRLEEIIKTFEENPEADLVYHGMYLRFYDPYHGAISRTVRPALPYSKEHLLREQYIPGQVAYKRKTILKLPYLESIRCCDDYDMLLRFALNNKKFTPIYKNLYEYSDSPDSINVSGEMDGSRKRDVEIILKWLKDDFDIDAIAGLIKNTISDGQIISREIINRK